MLKAVPAAARWDRSSLPLLLEGLARRSGIALHGPSFETLRSPTSDSDISEWIDAACRQLGLEAEWEQSSFMELASSLAHAAPALLALPDGSFAGLAGVSRGKARLLTADFKITAVPVGVLRDALCAAVEASFEPKVNALLRDFPSTAADPVRLRRAVLLQYARFVPVMLGWQIRVPAGSSFPGQMLQAGLRSRAAKFSAAYAAEYILSLGSWWLLGRAALTGRFDTGWLFAWMLMLACGLVFRVWRSATGQALSVAMGGLLKQRLIAGAVRLNVDLVRHQGAGGMLARVMETEAVESLAIGGGLAALGAPIELLSAVVLLWLGGSMLQVLVLASWIGILGILFWRQQAHRAAWMDARLAMTDDLVERMNGHRTQLSQQHPSQWHEGEDQRLDHYLERSATLDRYTVLATTMVPRLWLLSGLAMLAPAFLRSSPPATLAISIAAILLAHRSLRTLVLGLGDLASALLAWRMVSPVFQAAAKRPEPGTAEASACDTDDVLLEACDLTFRYGERSEPVLRRCNLTIQRADRILIEGASGDGKSTLASLLAGLRAPESGLLLAGGLDYHTLGEAGWRRRVTLVAQSHENHIFSASLAFNLLMGRAWPPRAEDLAEAQKVCCDLGLESLVARMPAGLDQMVGESGWQLSEGEKSRVFLGRALLSQAEVLVLDECFAPLDGKSLSLAYRALNRRAKAVVMVAHR